jgi:hypothetical protein
MNTNEVNEEALAKAIAQLAENRGNHRRRYSPKIISLKITG